ncbi:MAG: NUDIX hydrolase [Leptolyngbyaceae cyanobacterium SM1_3_5]|nr:NUDIX hydrolase [Leptolyngbyaceae cyanobacterium SM1_3_5]
MAQRFAIAWQQSGVIPYRWQNGQLEILLVTTSSGKRWGIPKGNVEILMSPAESACKEAREEAGVLGTVITPAIGSYEYRKRSFTNYVQVFWLRVETELEIWEEASLRRRRWMSLEQAIERVKPPLREFLDSIDDSIVPPR